MSSDPSDPMNQTGTGLPVFGKIKKLGEEEQAPEENFIPQEEYYDPEDFQDPNEQSYAEEQPVVAPPSPQAPRPGLQLQQRPQVPAPPQAPRPSGTPLHQQEDEERLQLRNRTAAHLAHKERAAKTIAQFDDYFEQEMKSEPGFIETYFKIGETFSPTTRKIIIGLSVAFLIFGIVISLKTFWLNLVFALISVQAVMVLSLQKGTLTKLGLFPGRIILAAVLAGLFIMVPVTYRMWQGQGVEYIQSFQNVENLANEAQEAIKDGVKKTEGTTGEIIDSENIATHEFKYAGGLSEKFHNSTYLTGGGLFQMYLQYVFLLFGMVLVPFMKERELLKVHFLRPENTKFQWKMASYFMVRMFKGTLIAVIFAVGLTFSGCENVMFIAGTTFFLAGLSRFGPVVGLIMCIPVVVAQFKAGNGMNALIGLAITGVVALLVESRFYWLMYVLPIKDKSIIPHTLSKPKQPVVKVEGQSSGMIFSFINLALTLAFYGAVAFLGWKVYGIWSDYSEVEKDIPRQVKKALGDGKSTAITKLEKYRENNPYNQDLIYQMTKAYMRAGMLDKALDAAREYRDFKSPEPDAEGMMEKGEQYMLKFLSKSNVKKNDKKALLWLLENFVELHANKIDSDALLFMIKEMQDTDPNEIKAYEMAGFHYMAKRKYDTVRSWCMKGLQIDKENVELLKLIVKTYIAENQKESALKALMNVDKVTTSDPEANELMQKIRAME